MRNKVLVIGSIADFGGREVEVGNIMEALSGKYDLVMFSTVPITKKSMAFSKQNYLWSSLHKELYNSSFLLKVLSLLNKKWNRSNLPAYLLVSNKISIRFLNFDKKNKQILKKQVASVDVVLFCGVFTNGYFKELISYCSDFKKPFLMRTTGTISEIPEDIKESLSGINTILVHSHSNEVVLKNRFFNNIKLIDQTTLVEKDLMDLEINKSSQLVFGYIGRFSQEKGIVELLEFFNKLEEKMIIAGTGPLLMNVKLICDNAVNLDYIGEFLPNKVVNFFKKIDVLIIPSYEEAGPLVGIEAMAAGKIIFSTKVGAMEERLKNTKNDFWFDIQKEDSFLELIEKLKQKSCEEIKEIRKVNRLKYLEMYSKDTIKNQYLAVIENVM